MLLLRVLLSCRAAICEEKQVSGRKQYHTIGSSLSTRLQEKLQSLVNRAERRTPLNQVNVPFSNLFFIF